MISLKLILERKRLIIFSRNIKMTLNGVPNKHLDRLMTPLKICNWEIKYQLGKGEDATVYAACCNNECKYVVKVISNTKQRSNFLSKVAKEIAMHEKFENIGLAPKLLDAWMNNNEASLVIEKKDKSIKEYITECVESGSFKVSELLKTIDSIEKRVLKLLNVAHKKNLVHNDLHLDNIMLDVDQDMDWSNIKFIDFGKSYIVNSEDEANSIEKEKEIILSFNMLRDLVTGKTKVQSKVPEAPKKKGRSPSRGLFTPSPTKMAFSPKSTPKKLFKDLDFPEIDFSPIKGGLMFEEI